MSKKDNFDAFDIEKYATRGGMISAPIYNSKVPEIDSRKKRQLRALKEGNTGKSKSFLRQLLDLFNKKGPSNQTNTDSSSVGKEETVISSVICHICGNNCNGKDFFCPKCGSKLKAGHFNKKSEI